MAGKDNVKQGNEKPLFWVYSEDSGWINIDDFLKKINSLSNTISNKLNKSKVQDNPKD